MINANRYISKGILLIILLLSIGLSAQESTVKGDCNGDLLKVYPDSLDYLIRSHRLDESMALADSLLSIFGHLNCPDVILIKASRANTYERHLDFETALEIYNEQLKSAQKFKFIEVEIKLRTALALLYEIIGRPEFCKEHLDGAFELINAHQLNQYLPEYYVRSSSYYRIFGNNERDKAIEYAKKAISSSKEYDVEKSLAGGYIMMGILTEDVKESMGYLKKASDLLYEIGDYIGSMSMERNLAYSYLVQGNFEQALSTINAINPHIVKYPGQKKVFYQLQRGIIDVKAKAYEGLGKKDSVINYLKDYNKYSRLLENYVNQEKINQLVMENVVQQEKEKIEYAEKQSKRLLFGLLFLLGFTLLLLRLYLLNRKKNQKINEQAQTISQNFDELQNLYQYQSTLLSEVHHRIKNNLQLIIGLMTLQKAKMGDSPGQEFLNVLSHRINSIALIHDQLYSLKEFEKVDVSIYSDALLKNMMTLTPNSDIQIERKVGTIQLNLETVTPLGLIWSELISNALKYNPNKTDLKIYFELTTEGENYFMHFHDNGKGYPTGKFTGNTNGIGHTIIQSLSRQLNAETHTYNEDGAHFTMKFKEKKISTI